MATGLLAKQLEAKQLSSRQTYQSLVKGFDSILEKAKKDGITSLAPFSFMLSFRGKPLSLAKHFWMAPMFMLLRPQRTLFKCARQLGKTVSIGGSDTLSCQFIPWSKSLFVAPLFAQSKRINDDAVRQLTSDTVFSGSFDMPGCYHGALRHTYKNHSEQLFSYAFTSCERIRGISAINRMHLDEIQNFDSEFIPIIEECSSAAEWSYFDYTGTPLTLDNIIEKYWQKSSQAEPWIRCPHCNKVNIATHTQQAMKMIGDGRDLERTVICAFCSKSLAAVIDSHDPEYVRYEHGQPALRHEFRSFHIPQIVTATHYRSVEKWKQLNWKLKNLPIAKFMNEVMGESWDDARLPITSTDLIAACAKNERALVNKNDYAWAVQEFQQFNIKAVGIDWGGGGDNGSTTTIAVGGCRYGTKTVEVIYMERINPSYSAQEEISRVVQILTDFNPDMLAHDYNSIGAEKEIQLQQLGLPKSRMRGYSYTFQPRAQVIQFKQASFGRRACYELDKTRSLRIMLTAVRQGHVQFPERESVWPFLQDFLQLREERKQATRKSDFVSMIRKGKDPDDMAHSVNFLVSVCWEMTGAYPMLSEVQEDAPSEEEIRTEMNPQEPHWGVALSEESDLL